MSNYHGKIMNITAGRNAVIEDNLIAAGVTTTVTAYNYGHRDARHAAAEIAIEADQRIAELEQLLAIIEAHDVRLESCDRDGQEYCDCLERAIAKLKARQ